MQPELPARPGPGTILITGATDGIGRSLARLYPGARLVLIGRRPHETLDPHEFPPQAYCRADLSQPTCAETIEHHLQTQGIRSLDLLIHNAGTGYYSPVADQPGANIRTLVDINLIAPLLISHRLYPYLARAGGKLVLIGSVVSALPCPQYAVYAASKAALETLGRNLRVELKNRVDVQVIHPGAARTGLHAKMGLSRQVVDWERFPPAEKIARRVTRAIQTRRPVVTLGTGNALLRFAGRFWTGLINAAIRKRAR